MTTRSRGVTVTVGVWDADIVGADNRALQAALEYVATLGGGTLLVLPGVYDMRDSLHLRSGVRVVGSGPETVLRKSDAVASPLVLDGDYGEEQLTVEDPAGFEPGMGITVLDDATGGFHVTVARITGKLGNTLLLSKPLEANCMVSQNARAHTGFPVISGYHLEHARVESLAVDGNKHRNPLMNGCRSAGVFLYRAHRCTIRDCIVVGFNGDGISFQQSEEVLVENCECGWNEGLGLHPGSGSQRPVVRGCWSHDNARIGLYLCWRVRNGVFEDNRLERNGNCGISIGHKDTDNHFARNLVSANGSYGIHFRDESEPMAGHRNTFESCRVLNNGNDAGGAGVFIDGVTQGVVFRDCVIGNDHRLGATVQRWGIIVGPHASGPVLESVEFSGNCDGSLKRVQA